MSKQAEAAVAEAIDGLKAGGTMDSVLGRLAYEHGRKVRDEVAAELKRLAIKGYDANG